MKDIKKYFIAGFDVLGYSNRVRECDKDLFGIISDSVNFVKKELSQKYDFQLKIFSDNFLLYSEDNCEGVLLATALMQAKLACSGVFTRGGVLLHDDLIITDDFVYGESIIRANEVETKVAKYPRIIIDKPLMAYLQSIENGLKILDSYFIKDNDGWFYIDYLEILKFANKDVQNIEIKYGDMSEKIPLSFSDELNAHRHYIEEELTKYKNKIESALLSSNFVDIEKHNRIKEKFIWVMKYHNQFCIKCGYYQHLIIGNIRGKMLRFSNDEIGKLDCQFQINLLEHRFCIVITDPEIIDNGFIHKLSRNETTLKSECVFGEDTEIDLKFTLCSCQICINRLNQKSPNKDGWFYIESAEICIFWESIIIGQHISCIDDLGITEMFVLAKSERQWFSHAVNKICYKIENNSIDVNVDFFEIKRKLYESWNIARKGCLFGLKPLQSIALRDMKESYKRLLDLYYLMVGYYPDNTRFWCNSEFGMFIHISHTDGFIKSKNKDMIFERNLYCSNMNDLSKAYSNWRQLHTAFTPIFTVFKRAVSDHNDISEMLTATFIQCLEAYFRQKHNCQNQSLSDVIIAIINCNTLTRSVIKDTKNFVSRVVEHREAADRLEFSINRNYFKAQENNSACMKLELLFRLCLLHDVGLDVKKDSVDNYVAMIERKGRSSV